MASGLASTRIGLFCLAWGLAATSAAAGLPRDWRDDLGRPLDLQSLQGAPLVLTMAYATCHRVCPATLHRLEALQRELDARGARATFVVLGYDPAHDDPATWHHYRREHGLTRANWVFLTAPDAAQVRRTADALGFEYWQYDEHVMHDERVVAFAPGGRLLASAGPGQVLHADDLFPATPRPAPARPSASPPARLAAGATGT